MKNLSLTQEELECLMNTARRVLVSEFQSEYDPDDAVDVAKKEAYEDAAESIRVLERAA